MLTGESMPVLKVVGDAVIGSTVNQDGLLHVEVTQVYVQRRVVTERWQVGDDGVLANILKLMENAQSSKAPIQVRSALDPIDKWGLCRPWPTKSPLCLFHASW